jgi:hypothetical protein
VETEQIYHCVHTVFREVVTSYLGPETGCSGDLRSFV